MGKLMIFLSIYLQNSICNMFVIHVRKKEEKQSWNALAKTMFLYWCSNSVIDAEYQQQKLCQSDNFKCM